jgi:hypothetical protein
MEKDAKRAVGAGRGERDPEVHMIKGQLAAQKAMEGRGTDAQTYRKLQNAAHAHMKGGMPSVAGGAMKMKTAPSVTGGAMTVEDALRMLSEMGKKKMPKAKGGAMTGGRPQLAGGAMASPEETEDEGMVEAVGGRKKRAKAGPSDARKKRGAMVSKLMKEKGMTLGEASKFIKEHGGV